MRKRFVAGCVVMAPLLIAASQPVRLQPSSPWDLDYAENSCRLMRAFGEGADKTLLLIESDAPGQMDMVVVGKPLNAHDDEVPAKFLPLTGPDMKGRPAESVQSGNAAVVWSSPSLLPKEMVARIEKEDQARRPGTRPPPLNLTEEAERRAERQAFATGTTELEIDVWRGHRITLETGSLGEPMRMFDKCSHDSLKDWGVDPELEAKIVRPVWAADAAKWFTNDDYPSGMWSKGEQSEIRVRLLVDASGKPTRCTTLSHYLTPEADKLVCDTFMRRARFEPAELADGTKVPSYYINRVRFQFAN
jgi:hypothetical protein